MKIILYINVHRYMYHADLHIVAEVVVLCLSHSVVVDPGYGSVGLEHGRHGVTATETKSKVLDGAVE